MARAAYLKIVDASGNKIPASAYSGHYEGASYGRRLNTWGTSSAGVNATLWSSLNTLRARSRQLVRNDPMAAGGIDTLVANLLGTDVSPFGFGKNTPENPSSPPAGTNESGSPPPKSSTFSNPFRFGVAASDPVNTREALCRSQVNR